MSTRTAGLTIRFMDGSKMTVRYPKPAVNEPGIVAAVRKALEADRLLIEADGTLLFVPLSNVKYLEVSPAPHILPANAVRHAHIVA